MDDAEIWWRRPRLLAAIGCVLLGVAVLVGGPLLRGAWAPAAPPLEEDLGLAILDAPPVETAPGPERPSEPVELIVYVSGAVRAPDVYRLPMGARVLDAVLAAGGLGEGADSEAVNLAAPLSDAEHVHIPHVGDATAAPAGAASGPAAAPAGGPLDLNRASAVDLEELPGIGQAIAGRIIAYREAQGPFRSVADLQNVAGIGDALYARISPLVTARP